MSNFQAASELIKMARSLEELEHLAGEYGYLEDDAVQARIFQFRLKELQQNQDEAHCPPPQSPIILEDPVWDGEDDVLVGVCEAMEVSDCFDQDW